MSRGVFCIAGRDPLALSGALAFRGESRRRTSARFWRAPGYKTRTQKGGHGVARQHRARFRTHTHTHKSSLVPRVVCGENVREDAFFIRRGPRCLAPSIYRSLKELATVYEIRFTLPMRY